MRNFLSTDGEDIVISNGYEPSLRERFCNQNTDYARVGASTTSIHNSCDRGRGFKDTKREAATTRQKGTVIRNDILRDSLKKAFSNLTSAYPSITQPTSAFKNNIYDGCEVLTHSWKKVFSPTEIRKSFSCCGQHCAPIADKDNITVSFPIMMAQCYTNFTPAQMAHMESKTLECSAKLEEYGTLTWAVMDEAGIPKHENSIDRMQLTHIRHWSEIINHEQTCARFIAEKAARDPIMIQHRRDENASAEANLKMAAKAVVDAQRLLDRTNKAETKK